MNRREFAQTLSLAVAVGAAVRRPRPSTRSSNSLQPTEFRNLQPRRLNQNLGVVYDELTSG